MLILKKKKNTEASVIVVRVFNLKTPILNFVEAVMADILTVAKTTLGYMEVNLVVLMRWKILGMIFVLIVQNIIQMV